MKKILLILLVFLISFCTFSLEIQHKTEVHDFDSIPMLNKYYAEQGHASSYWEKVKISLLTLTKMDEIYSWFGHTGLLVETPQGISVIYDYGRFAFSSDFYINFIKGQLWYGCGGYYSSYTLDEAVEKNRSVSKIELKLTNEQKAAVVDFLQINSTSPYNKYLYHHYNDNCATRIRDIINYATNGDFEVWAKAQPGFTFRQQTSRILHNNMAVEWVLDFLQGPSIDTPATRWEEMFLPENLEKAVLEYGKITDDFSYIIDNRATDNRPKNYEEPQHYEVQALIVGFIIALSVLLFAKYCPAVYITETSILNFFLVIIGSILFYMMYFSGHSFSWGNENIIYVSPLIIVAFIFGFKPKKHNTVLTYTYGLFSAAAILLILLKAFIPGKFSQDNYPQLLAVLPYYIANFAVCLFRVK